MNRLYQPIPALRDVALPHAHVASVGGVGLSNATQPEAVQLLDWLLCRNDGRPRSVFFVNAHTLNLAITDLRYRDVLRSADYVFGDGIGVRWAARLEGVRLRDNLVGTDIVPALFDAGRDRGYRYFLLGADESSIFRAAQYAAARFTGWIQTGYHHGYLNTREANARVIRQINEASPHLLLVGQGNPIQERWIHDHQRELRVPVCMAVGGLFNYWAGDIHRSPACLRRCGMEWLGILWQQPHKTPRYLLGNPLFLARMLFDRFQRRRQSCRIVSADVDGI